MIDEFLKNGALELIEKEVAKAAPHALDRHETSVVALIERIVKSESEPLARRAGEIRARRAREAQGAGSQASDRRQEGRLNG